MVGRHADCDLVIEAVFEDLEQKQGLFRALDGLCKPETILASNTSTLSITELASAVEREDRVVGMHFCLPAQLMKLIETLEDDDDVQNVTGNFDFSDEVATRLEG